MQDLVRYALYGIPLFFCFYILETVFILLSIKNMKRIKLGKFYFIISILMNKLYNLSLVTGLIGLVFYCLSIFV